MDNPLDVLLSDWQRHLRIGRRSPRTIQSYTESVLQVVDHAGATDVEDLDRRAVEAYLEDLAARYKPATVAVRYRSLQQWFRFLEEEEEIADSPMRRIPPPNVPDQPVDILSDDQLRALLKACEGKSFIDRRDTAIVRLFIDTGMRLGELAGLALDDLDLQDDVARVMGKGGRMRACPFGDRTGQALTRYLRARGRHAMAHTPALWLGGGSRAGMTESGVAQMLRRRGRQAAIDNLHPHLFRHLSPISGCRLGARRGICSVWLAGGRGKCCSVTVPQRPMSEHGRRTRWLPTIPHRREGRNVLIDVEDLEAWVEAQRIEPGTVGHLYVQYESGAS